jgi:cytoskeletal protein CcmA (bactofilin family)
MRFLSRGLVVVGLFGAVGVLTSSPASAAETSNSEFVIIRPDDVVTDDLYAGAIRVVVEGRLEGDLVAFAAEEVVIEGTVTGSVLAIAPRVTITGEVGGSVRVSGNTLEVDGTVDGDVVAAVWTAVLSPESVVNGDVLVWGWRVDATGTIGQDLTGTQRTLNVAGEISGDVDVSVSQLTIVGPLTVDGDLAYRSAREAAGLEDADVAGAIVQKSPLAPNLRVRALSLLGRFMVVLFLTVAALTAAYGWPQRTTSAVAEVGRRPVRNWLKGAGLLFAPLAMAALTGVLLGLAPAAAAFPLLAVLVPVILALAGLSFALALVAGAPAVGWLGGVLFRRLDLYGAILAGSLLVGVLWYVPVIGWLVPVIVLPLGLGAWMSQLTQSSSESMSTDSSSSHSR